jgi:LacI family transcriptional regulator
MREAKHQAILRVLRSRILRGVYEGRMPGERQFAAEFHVDTSTIELALVQLGALGLVHRKLRSGTFVVPEEERANTLSSMSVLLSEASFEATAVQSQVTGAFGEEAQARGIHVVLAVHPDSEPALAVDEAIRYLKSPTCIGACLFDYPLDHALALRLAEAPGPAVIADWESPDLILPTINYDNREAGRLAAAHLLKQGHRRIVLVDPLPLTPNRVVRAEGAADLVRQTGGSFRHLHDPDFGWNVPPCVALLQEPDRPTALICGSWTTAFDMVAAATSLGLTIPGDISLMHFGGRPDIRRMFSFTNIEFNETAMGVGAFDLLLNSAPGQEPQRVLVPVKLMDRGTTAPPKQP